MAGAEERFPTEVNPNLLARIHDELRSLNAKLDDVVKREDLRSLEKRLDEVKRAQTELNTTHLNATRTQAAISKEIKQNVSKMMEQIAIIKRSIAKSEEYNIVIAGGWDRRTRLNSVEYYASSMQSWSALQPMKQKRSGARSIMFNNRMMVSGGHNGVTREKSLEYLHLNPVNPSKEWHDFDTTLEVGLSLHGAVLHNMRLISLGGRDDSLQAYDSIHEVMLTPPYATNLLGRLPQVVRSHGAVVFGNKIVVCGGTPSESRLDCVSDLVEFDIGQRECRMLPPLPFPVCDMAVVKHGNNLVLLGGADSDGNTLQSVVCYNIELGTSERLPDMRYARQCCAAVVVGERVVVMGGTGHDGNILKSVETYMFGGNYWEDLPEMKEARNNATAVGWQ